MEDKTMELPNLCAVVKLGEISEIKYGNGLPTKDFKETGYPVYGANGVIGIRQRFLHF